MGEIFLAAGEASDSKVMLVASGSLSRKICPNKDDAANNGTSTISSEFARQMDTQVRDVWQRFDPATFLRMLPECAEFCSGGGSKHDTAMFCGALGWDIYTAPREISPDHVPSSGTGQTNDTFPVQ